MGKSVDDRTRERLAKLGVTKGLRPTAPVIQPPAPAPKAEQGIDDALPGSVVQTPSGPVWVERRAYPQEYRHGRYSLGMLADLSDDGLRLMGNTQIGARPALLDIETSGPLGGAGVLAFLVGIGVWDAGQLTLHLIFMRSPAEEEALLRHCAEVLADVTGLVTFGGKGFDLPILHNRSIVINKLIPGWNALPHLDLLPAARMLWRDHLRSRRMIDLETSILGIERSEQDIPSWEIPGVYHDYLSSGKTHDIARVFYHNRVDVLGLAALLAHITRAVAHPHDSALAAGEWAGIGRFYERAGMEVEAIAAWETALSGARGTLDDECAGRLWEELSTRAKRAEIWERAQAVWQAWSDALPCAVDPLIEQAKYAEWTSGDEPRALELTDTALERLTGAEDSVENRRALNELLHRRERLERKLKKDDEACE